MNKKKFDLWNRLSALVAFLVAAVTYLLTIEPTASFWDCGEFIASSYKLEVGHPPGNPVFQLIARFFTIFGDNMHAAVLVNAMSAICSALTIFLLYLTIVFFAKRMFGYKQGEDIPVANAIAIFGSGLVGALAYCFTDTFWFSAVEGEVYAMSSLFTALVFWAMTKWYEVADTPYANRWIVLISFLMGLSIGIHLLNLLAIPAIVYLYYYKKREEAKYSFWELVKIMLVSVVILALVLFIIVPYIPKIAGYFDLLFVNGFGLPYNSGAVFFVIALFAACFWGLFITMKKQKVFWNTVLLCFTVILVGFSTFSICVIRSSVKTPTNEYQPDNPFTLVRYLSREQYGSTPLLYGQYFDAPYDIVEGTYWAPMNGKYIKADKPLDANYRPEGKMLFPRMWNGLSANYVEFYESYMDGKGTTVPGASHKKPTMGTNLKFFFDYQLGWMYWRYFMWNFAGRQNQIHSPAPGNPIHGNWESGIKFLDEMRLGNHDNAPDSLANDKGKNHYYMLPLLLGLIGLFFQYRKDKRGCWLVFLMFFMTGIAIVVYLNQPPYQVRERDYAYAGSFYSFSIWIGFAVAALYSIISEKMKSKNQVIASVAITVICLLVPVQMASENWDDHDRSNRYTCPEMAYNFLNSVGPNGILITHGDNDTFPLWYAQEVEEVRTDIRICNTSLLGTDWHIDQMKYAVNESAPLPLSIDYSQYLYGTNEHIYIYDTRNQALPLKDVITVFKHPEAKLSLSNGDKVDYIMSKKFIVPVNKENAIKSGIVPAIYADMVPESIVLEIPEGKDYLTKPELFMLDLLSNYEWDRPINLLNMGGELNIGIKDYLMYDGFSYRFVPFRNNIGNTDPGLTDPDHLYKLMTETFKFDALSRDDYFVDYQHYSSFMGTLPTRSLFTVAATAMFNSGRYAYAEELLDRCQEILPAERYPLDGVPIGFINSNYMICQMIQLYFNLGRGEKAVKLAEEFSSEMLDGVKYYLDYYPLFKSDFDYETSYCSYLAEILTRNDNKELADTILANISSMINQANEAR